MPCAAGGTPTVSEVKRRGRRGRHHRGDGATGQAGQVRGQMPAFLQLQPAQAVDDQQDHLAGVRTGSGNQAGRCSGGRRQTGDHAGQVGALIGRQHRRGKYESSLRLP